MNVAKNWALTILLIALASAHFSSELLLKEQWLSRLKKTLTNAGHIDTKLIDFSEISPKKSSAIGCSCFCFPPKFPMKSADFSKNLPLKILRNLTFFRKNPTKLANFSTNFDFFPGKIPQIGRFFREFWLSSRENPAKILADFSVNLPLKILRSFAFFREISEALW